MPASCPISFVVTTRNDDHGKNMLRRFQLFVDQLLEQADRHGLSGELIVVEWNPPPGPRLHDLLEIKKPSDIFTVRFIEVPAEIHRAIRNSDVIPLFQMIAKNVGIRRARGEFVLATNPDLLFSDALFSFFAARALRRDCMYRMDRFDVPASAPENVSTHELLAWCEVNVLRVHTRWGTFPSVDRWKRLRRLATSARIKSQAIVRSALSTLRILLPALLRGLSHVRRVGVGNLLLSALQAARPTRLLAFTMEWAKAFRRSSLFITPLRIIRGVLWLGVQYLSPYPKIHTNGCGDFTLLARDAWFKLRGYPELPLWSMHLDSLLCYMAAASGLQETILRKPKRVFHLEHENSWVVLSADDRLRTFATKPWLDVGLLAELWSNMFKTSQPLMFNSTEWGLANADLEEVWITGGNKTVMKNRSADLAATGS